MSETLFTILLLKYAFYACADASPSAAIVFWNDPTPIIKAWD
jgi:hypothetical protein